MNESTSDENEAPYGAIFFATCSVLAILSNAVSMVFYFGSGPNNVHGFFIMSLCLGNSLMGCSTFLSVANYLVEGAPYVCAISTGTMTWGIVYNIFMTFWICLEKYIIVHRIPMKTVNWMQTYRYKIVSGTAVGIAIYLTMLFTITQDNNAVICDGVHLFRHLYPVFAGMTSIPVLCFLIIIVVLYSKTLRMIALLAPKDKSINIRNVKRNVLFEKRTMSDHRPNSVLPSTSSKLESMDICDLEDSEYLASDKNNETIYTCKIKKSLSSEDMQNLHVHLTDISIIQETNRDVKLKVENAERTVDLIQDSEKCDDIKWHKKAQNNVRTLIVLVSIYSLSLIVVQILAIFNIDWIRYCLLGILLICVLVSPFLYVLRVHEVKVAMKKAFHCKSNIVDVSREF
ncbi:unnamed protein product [Mytilus coruscus]|uniref:G-protein coupled receptors family 1 profile domain-containing protein n=1 Tax=Mytilus coruscus TaxID=42192 RepID=A0A6J8EC37_MYTCO|nr:unnamed protein product [Mytilus coruscus]